MTQVSQTRQRGHISRDFVGARGETGSLFSGLGAGMMGPETTVKRPRMELAQVTADPEVERWRSLTLKSTVIFD